MPLAKVNRVHLFVTVKASVFVGIPVFVYNFINHSHCCLVLFPLVTINTIIHILSSVHKYQFCGDLFSSSNKNEY